MGTKLHITSMFFLLGGAMAHASTSFADKEIVVSEFTAIQAIVGIILVALVAVGLRTYYRRRVQRLTAQSADTYQSLHELTEQGNTKLFIYDINDDTYSGISDNGQIEVIARDVHVSEFIHKLAEKGREYAPDIISGKKADTTYRLVDESDGQKTIYQVNLRALGEDEANKGKMLVVMSDITQQEKEQEEIHHNQLRYEAAFRHSSFAITFFDQEGRITDMNEAGQQLYGLTGGEYLDNPLFTFQNLFQSAAPNDQMEQYSLTNLVNVSDYVGERPDFPLKRYFNTIITPMFDANHHLTGLFSISRDITQQVETIHQRKDKVKLIDEMSRRANIYLAQANETLQHYGMKVVRYYPSRHELEVHERFGEVTKVLTLLDCYGMTADEDKEAVSHVLRALEERIPDTLHFATRLTQKDEEGRPLVIDYTFIPQFDTDGQVDHYVGMGMNVSESVHADEQIALEAEKAKDAERTKDAFLQNVDHDVRVPLNAIVGFANMLAEDHPAEQLHEYVDEIQKNSNELLDLINNVLLFSRIEANMVEIKPVETDFAKEFEAICKGEADNYPHLHITVDNKYARFVADLDVTNLTHAIRMVLKQVARYQNEAEVRITYVYTDNELGITIEDHGESIPQEAYHHLRSNLKTHSTKDYENEELPLQIADQLITRMGGKIKLQSSQGRGNVVWMLLPCRVKGMDLKF